MASLGLSLFYFVLATGFGTTSACYVATSLTYCIIATGTEQTEAKAGNPQDSFRIAKSLRESAVILPFGMIV